LSQIIADLTKLKFLLRKKLSPATVLDGIELACSTGCGKDRVEEILRAGWATDPVHPNAHIYAKMALNLLEKLSAGSDSSRQPGVARKRKRSESSSSSVTAHVSNAAQVAAQGSSRGSISLRGGAPRGQARGRGRGNGWDAGSAHSGNSHYNYNRGGGFQDRGRGHRGRGDRRPGGRSGGHYWPRW
jgi:hypothetical protein